jgi:hypothetical protein
MEHRPPWEANSFLVSQEIPRILWNLEFHYSIHNSLPIVPILNQLNPVHNPVLNSVLKLSNILIKSTSYLLKKDIMGFGFHFVP